MCRADGTTTCFCAGTKARSLGRRLAAFTEEKTRSRLPATVGLTSPSSATKTAALERWNGGTTTYLPLLAEKDKSPLRPWNIQLSATALAAERESERTTPATGSTDSTDPWRWKKKIGRAHV